MSNERFRDITTEKLTAELTAVLDYWIALADGRVAPTWPEFDLMRVPARILPTTMVIDVKDPVEDNVFRFWGSRLSDIHGQDLTGRHPIEIKPAELANEIVADHKLVAADKTPSARHYSFTTVRGFEHSHSLLRLPLCNDGENVSQIIVAVDYSPEALELVAKEGPKFRERVAVAEK